MESPIALKVIRLSRDIYWLLESPFFVIAEKRSVCLERGHSHKPLCVDRPLEISVGSVCSCGLYEYQCQEQESGRRDIKLC